jgi:hypothetical protein
MVDNAVDIRRTHLRRLHTDARGKQHLGGRWSMERIAQFLLERPHKRFTLDDLARFVYGTTSKKYRDNVRKHIPAQRNHMLARMTPFITEYGPRGVILGIKVYEQDVDQDRTELGKEVDRLYLRGEVTRERYLKLCDVLRLPPPTIDQPSA